MGWTPRPDTAGQAAQVLAVGFRVVGAKAFQQAVFASDLVRQH